MAREQSERVSRIHDESLLVCHGREILHHQTVLRPVLEHGSVTAVCDELMRMLCHTIVQVVLDHRHDGSRLT